MNPLQDFVSTGFVQRGKWRSPGGGSRRFDSSRNDFVLTWYPGKLNSLIFGGADGEKSKDYLISIFLSLECTKATQTNLCFDDLKVCMDDLKLDIEILQSRVDSIQSYINTTGNSLTNSANIEIEVVRLQVELVKEKTKNSILELKVKNSNEEFEKVKALIHRKNGKFDNPNELIHAPTINENRGT